MMKTYIPILAIVLFSSTVMAQGQVLLSGDPEHGVIVSVRTSVSTVMDEPSLLIGGHGAYVINRTLFVGGGGYGMVSQIDAPTSTPDEKCYLAFGYGGLELGTVIRSNSLVHLRLSTLLGGGGIATTRRFNHDEDSDYIDDDGMPDAIWIAEPTVEVVLNVTRFIRLTAGASYRLINGIDSYSDYRNSDFTGPSVVVSLDWGLYSVNW